MRLALLATLAAAVIESCLYGLRLILFLAVLYLRNGRGALIINLGIVGFLVLVTIHWIITLYQSFNSIVQLGGGMPAAKLLMMLLAMSVFVSDTLVIHQLWSVWGHRRSIILFPSLVLVGQSPVLASSSNSHTGALPNPSRHFIPRPMAEWPPSLSPASCAYRLSAELALTLDTVWFVCHLSICYTALIACKIISIARTAGQTIPRTASGCRLTTVVAIISMESAAVQTLTIALTLIAFEAQLALRLITPVAVALSTILVRARVALGNARDAQWQRQTNLNGQMHFGTPHEPLPPPAGPPGTLVSIVFTIP
ncbi:hypothetical protein FB451DRAFT_1418864 [Mycena latifolia]|nr:hypothetical protein FB451DRAFT_1418864 [Mycena latifolia]